MRYLRYRATLTSTDTTVTPTVHDVTVCFENVPTPTTLTVAPAAGVYGTTSDLSATLTAGPGVGGKTVAFTLNGNPAGSGVTNGSGVATVLGASLAGINSGTYPGGVAATFTGDAAYLAASGSNTLTVTPQSLLASTAKPDGEDWYGFYTVGWLVNHYLTFSGQRPGQLQTYLRLVNGGMNSAPAARQAFGDLDKLASDIQKYKHSGKLGGADVVPGTKANLQIAMRRLGPDEEAVMKSTIRTKSGPTKAEARGVAGDVRGLAKQYPNSLPIYLELASAEAAVKNYDGAEAAADRALQINPKSVEVSSPM